MRAQFGMGSFSLHGANGPVVNPWTRSPPVAVPSLSEAPDAKPAAYPPSHHTAGGSSGGSAAAVAGGDLPFASSLSLLWLGSAAGSWRLVTAKVAVSTGLATEHERDGVG